MGPDFWHGAIGVIRVIANSASASERFCNSADRLEQRGDRSKAIDQHQHGQVSPENIYSKTGVISRTGAALTAIRDGVVEVDDTPALLNPEHAESSWVSFAPFRGAGKRDQGLRIAPMFVTNFLFLTIVGILLFASRLPATTGSVAPSKSRRGSGGRPAPGYRLRGRIPRSRIPQSHLCIGW